tara:strand:- start:208 stop:522 length:315 start_codon:yes stop_codon:yes gene_type:complete
MSIEKLIDQTHQAIRKVAQHPVWVDTEVVDLYTDDLNDFESVQWLINADDIDGAKVKIDGMWSEPREQILMAIADEYGNGYVETVLGYEVPRLKKRRKKNNKKG